LNGDETTRFEIKIKEEKEDELRDYNSELMQLLRKTVKKLRATCKNQKRKPRLFINFSRIRKTFGVDNVPAETIQKLQKIFDLYAERPVRKKRHVHKWVLTCEERGILWLKCVDQACDAEAQLLVIDDLGIAQKIILPYLRCTQQNQPLYRTKEERQRIKEFLRDYKEETLRSAMAELEKELVVYQKILDESIGKVNESKLQRIVRRLQRDKRDIQTAMLVL